MQSATPSTTPTPSVDLDAGKDLTTLDDASLLGELGFEAAPEGAAPAEKSAQELEDEVVNDVVPQSAATDGTDDVAEDVSESEPETPAAPAPTTPNAAATPAAEKQLAAKFAVFDPEGELEIPEIAVSFEADGGKKFEKVPLDKVVRLAQQGVYNHRLQTEVQQARETQSRFAQVEQQLADQQAAHQRTIDLAERLLTEPEFFEKALGEYEAYNSPEAVIARQQAEIASLRTRQAQPNAGPTDADKAQVFFNQTATPVIASIVQQHPTVTQQELLGQFMLLTAPLQVNGRIPPSRFADVERILTGELAPWAQSVHEERSADAAERKKAAAAAERAKQAAINSKRQLTRAIKPVGGRAAPDVARAQAPRDADDAAAQIIAGIFSGA